MKLSFQIFYTLSLVFFISSCSKSEEFIPGEFSGSSKMISESDRYCASYYQNEEEVKIVVEDLFNTSDNRFAKDFTLDWLSIRFDINNNNIPDNNTDKIYSISQLGNPCMALVLQDGNATTGCSEEFGYVYLAKYGATAKSSVEHIYYELTIRKENIFSQSGTIGLIFVMNGLDGEGAVPLLFTPLFKETLPFSI